MNLLLIYGFPRGGTSAVAGALSAAGFNLGLVADANTPTPAGRSAYRTFECGDYIRVWKHRKPPGGGPSDQYSPGGFGAFAEYIARRARMAGPQAVKRPGLHLWSCSPEWVDLPVVTLAVRRPIEDSVASNAYRRKTRTESGWAEHLGRMAESMALFESQKPPVHVVNFYDLLADPESSIRGMLEAVEPFTGSPPGGWMIERAVRSVDRRLVVKVPE